MLTVDEVMAQAKTEADHSADDNICWIACPNVGRLQVYRHKPREAVEIPREALPYIASMEARVKASRLHSRAAALFKEAE